MSDPPSKRTYSQEEVTEILKRAMKQQSLQKQGLSHDELVEMAGEVGIDRAAVESATTELVETRADELAKLEAVRELAQERSRLFSGFVSSFFFYVVICGALYFIDTRFTGGSWYYWPMFGWGIALIVQLNGVLFPQHSLERRKERELRRAHKQERRALRRERTRRLRETFGLDGLVEDNRRKAETYRSEFEADVNAAERQHDTEAAVNAGAREFETAVQAGVAALLNVAARKIHEHASKAVEAGRSDSFKRRR